MEDSEKTGLRSVKLRKPNYNSFTSLSMEKNIPYQDKPNPWSSHHLIMAMLEGLPEGARVLDVGAASGTLARMCSGRGYTLRGIEPIAEWVSFASQLYDEIFIGDLEQAPDTYLQGHVAVVCGDILEHLLQPEVQLRRLVAAQMEGCRFVISVPNIANIWVRWNLLFGRFDYSDRGILDRTHLHFFTRKSFVGLLRDADLQILELRATAIPLDLVNPFFVQNRLGKGLFACLAYLTQQLPTLLGYQWVAKAFKIEQPKS